MTIDRCIDKIEKELQEHSHGYTIRPLKLKEWGMPLKANGFDTDDSECVAYSYGTMINMIYLLKSIE
jgi:hypothetical protein